MGPYVPKREKAEWEIDMQSRAMRIETIAEALSSRSSGFGFEITDRLHGGRWEDAPNHYDHHLRCTDCEWQSNGPPGAHGGRDNIHIQQWNRHRAEMAIIEGVLT